MAVPQTKIWDLDPSVIAAMTPGQRIAHWAELMDAFEQEVLECLRREIGPTGDLKAAYRRWYQEQMKEHDEAMFRMMRRMSRMKNSDSGRGVCPSVEDSAQRREVL
jgi:hypothetical protein